MSKREFDIIVVGAGHAGSEAALASARMGKSTALITLKETDLGALSCNPAVGGIGKGQLVKEIDALGGELGKVTDYAGIQLRVLNVSKGAAVHSSRVQVDRNLFAEYMREKLNNIENLTLIYASVYDLLFEDNKVIGVKLIGEDDVLAQAVIITPGTFINGLIHIGLKNFPGGRIGDEPALKLSESLQNAGIELMRFKTGTCARLNTNTIDYSKCEIQYGDKIPQPFSFDTAEIKNKQLPCYITYTNKRTHEIIRGGMDRSPLYSGIITGTGVRYCPSIEDKIMRFQDRDRHQIFLEPEGLSTLQVYPNGISTSLPEDVQLKMIHSIRGLEKAEVLVFGYGIEHDVINVKQLYPTMENKKIKGLYFAGQINGTTGYEEAAAQGLIAGINAVLKIDGKEKFILDRASSYIGVLLDDLVTKGTKEPYRMFTSRVEYRLVLREDNADKRLSEIGFKLGLLSRERYEKFLAKKEAIESIRKSFSTLKIKATEEINKKFENKGLTPLKRSLKVEEVLRRPGVNLEFIKNIISEPLNYDEKALNAALIEIKYAGYIERQMREINKFNNLEKIAIPADFVYENLSGLSREIENKLKEIKPISLGQASRISGVTPAAIMLLMVHLKKKK